MKKIVALAVLFVGLFANEHVALSDTDFIPRVINFVIFAGILWYLLADKVKDFYANRSKEIADAFTEVEEKLKQSRAHKEALKKEVELAHKKAEDIIKTATKEAELIKSHIIAQAKEEVEILNKNLKEQMAYEESLAKREVVKAYLETLLKDVHLSSEEVANIVAKKVG